MLVIPFKVTPLNIEPSVFTSLIAILNASSEAEYEPPSSSSNIPPETNNENHIRTCLQIFLYKDQNFLKIKHLEKRLF